MDSTEAKNKVLVISSMRCAGYLMFHGCKLIRTQPHREHQNKNIFIFNDDDKTKEFLSKYTNEVSKAYDSKNLHHRENQRRVQRME